VILILRGSQHRELVQLVQHRDREADQDENDHQRSQVRADGREQLVPTQNGHQVHRVHRQHAHDAETE
jgi:hypothetical protein